MKSNTPNYNPSSSSDIFTAFRQIIKTYLSDFVFTADPVKVVEVGADGYLTVRPVIQQETTSGETLSFSSDDDICNVRPLYFLGGGTELSFEAAAGDYGLLIACKSDVAKYASAHTEAVGGLRQFSLSNGFFLPIDFFPTKRTKLTISRTGTTEEAATSSIVLDDTGITVTTTGVLSASAKSATVTTTEAVEVSAKSATITTTEAVNVSAQSATVTADSVSLGGAGGAGVARVGDAVSVTVASGSSAGTWTGTITAGSAKVTAQ